jgi:hypothetical protein
MAMIKSTEPVSSGSNLSRQHRLHRKLTQCPDELLRSSENPSGKPWRHDLRSTRPDELPPFLSPWVRRRTSPVGFLCSPSLSNGHGTWCRTRCFTSGRPGRWVPGPRALLFNAQRTRGQFPFGLQGIRTPRISPSSARASGRRSTREAR